MKHVLKLAFQVAIAAAAILSLNARPAVGQEIRTGGVQEGQPFRSDTY